MNLAGILNEWSVDPSLLSHPNIPKPLHGVNPRNIMGRVYWDEFRQGVYRSTDFHCKACGVAKQNAKKHQWLEAHENFDIDYRKATVTIKSVVPLCHYCHSFIHSGLLRIRLNNGDIFTHEAAGVLEHGIDILVQSEGAIFTGTRNFAIELGVDVCGLKTFQPTPVGGWSKWKMLWNGKQYPAKFKSMDEWRRHYK